MQVKNIFLRVVKVSLDWNNCPSLITEHVKYEGASINQFEKENQKLSNIAWFFSSHFIQCLFFC